MPEQNTIQSQIDKADFKWTKVNETIENFKGLKSIEETDMKSHRAMTKKYCSKILNWTKWTSEVVSF